MWQVQGPDGQASLRFGCFSGQPGAPQLHNEPSTAGQLCFQLLWVPQGGLTRLQVQGPVGQWWEGLEWSWHVGLPQDQVGGGGGHVQGRAPQKSTLEPRLLPTPRFPSQSCGVSLARGSPGFSWCANRW